MFMEGEGHIGVRYQAGNFILHSNDKIYAMKKEDLYSKIFRERINKISLIIRSLSKRS